MLKSKSIVFLDENQSGDCSDNKELRRSTPLKNIKNYTPVTQDKGRASKNVHCLKFKHVKPKVDTHWTKSNETITKEKTAKTKTQIIAASSKCNAVENIAPEKNFTSTYHSENIILVKETFDLQNKDNEGKNDVQNTKMFTNTNNMIKKQWPKSRVSATSSINIKAAAMPTKLFANKVNANKQDKINQSLCRAKENNTLCERNVNIQDNTATVIVTKNKSLITDEICDINEKYHTDIFLVSQYVDDIYSYLYTLEDQKPIQQNFMKGHTEIHGKLRDILVNWISEIAYKLHLLPETFQLSVAIINHYLNMVKNIKCNELLLIGPTALFLATKYVEVCFPSAEQFAYITSNAFTVKEMCETEKKLLKTLQYNLSFPLPIEFLRRFSRVGNVENCQYKMAKYFIELTMIKSEMAHYKCSEIAAASLFLSLNLLKHDNTMTTDLNDTYWTPALESCSSYSMRYLMPIIRKIAVIVRNAPKMQLQAVYKKYQLTKFEKISTRPELYGPLMDSIINSVNDN